MDILDDDCLVSIFNHVPDLRDQVHIARSCHRFEDILKHIWRHQKRYQTLNLSEWCGWLPDVQDLTYFLRAISNGLSSIVVGDETLNEFLLKMQQVFKATANNNGTKMVCLPNVQHFLDDEKSVDTIIADSDMKLLAHVVPNLISLYVREPLSGCHVSDFLKLEELYLYVQSEISSEVENAHFKEICIQLKHLRILDIRRYDGKSHLDLSPVLSCENLAVLKVNLNALRKCLTEVLSLPKLVTLNVMLDFDIDIGSIQNVDTFDFKIYETAEFYDILKTQSKRIIGLAIDLYYFPLGSNWASNLELWRGGSQLKKFCLCNCDFSADPLINYVNPMESLEILSCRHWQNLKNEHILHFVECCPKLVHLDLSYCSNIDGRLVYQLIDVLKKCDRKRSLHIYYLRSGLENEVKKMMLQLLDLNDDCLYGICSCLDLTDLLSMKNVCSRLDMIVKLLWRYRCKTLSITYKQMMGFKEKGNRDFIEMITSVCESLEKLTIDSIESSQLKLICHLKFPRLKFLECNISHDKNYTSDEDVLLLTKLCPFITRLILTSSTTGKYINRLHQLTELDLSCCNYLDTEYLAEICNTLKLRKLALLYYGYNTVLDDGLSAITDCHTLEELKIDDHHLLLFIDDLLRMPSMRKLVCYTRDYDVFLMRKLAQAYGVRIHTLILNSVLWSNDRHIGYICLMLNLQRFILQDDDIEDEQLELLTPCLKQLREMHFINSRLESDYGILEIVKHCVKLEVLNLTKSNISSDFLINITNVLNETKRNGILKLYVGGTKIANEQNKKNEQLQVSIDDQFLDLPCGRCFQCEW